MRYSAKNTQPSSPSTDCVAVGIYEGGKLSTAAQTLDKASKQHIQSLLKAGDMQGKVGESLMLYHLPHLTAERVLLIGCGNRKELTESKYRLILSTMGQALKKSGAKEAMCYLTELAINDRDIFWKIRQGIDCIDSCYYQFNQLKSKKETNKTKLTHVTFFADKPNNTAIRKMIAQAQAITAGVNLAKDLGNLPGNICTPTYLANQAKALAKQFTALKTSVLTEAQMEKLGMGALLSVSHGSDQPAKLICLQYQAGKKNQKPVALVGKGITFDSGGISIKPGQAMDEMKYDMCGAASVLGTFRAIAELKLPINVVGMIAASENLPSGSATKPGDIVTTMSGQTVEILNTDAEGRLVLSDAITYSKKFKPDVVIDIATLTGAMVVALGGETSGVFSNHDPLAADLIKAGEYTRDRTWQMPVWEDYQSQLDSNFADMANIGNRSAGSITAACFLARFAKDMHWAHLDIAGVAWKSGKAKGSTGRPVPLLTQYLIDRCER